jgi:hypothetical protein
VQLLVDVSVGPAVDSSLVVMGVEVSLPGVSPGVLVLLDSPSVEPSVLDGETVVAPAPSVVVLSASSLSVPAVSP